MNSRAPQRERFCWDTALNRSGLAAPKASG
jgi:hypothetical protein